MLLTLMSQNLQFGGLRGSEGKSEDRWSLLLERIKSVTPAVDLLLIEEATGWGTFGHKQLAQAMSDLDMDALPLAPTSSGNGVGLLYRRDTVGRWQRWNTDYAQQTIHGFGVASFDVGLPSLLSIVPVHLSPFGSDKALEEIGLITNRAYRYGPFAVLGGDLNYAPAQGPEPNYDEMKPYNFAMRTMLDDPGEGESPTPDRRIGWKLAQAGFVDAAYYLYTKTDDRRFLDFTCTQDRIDQFWVTKPLANAIKDYWIVDAPEAASDHKGIVLQIDTELIDATTTWSYT